MTIESLIEESLKVAFAGVLPDGAAVVCSRRVADEGEVASAGDDDKPCVVGIAAAYRSHDDFSLPMISVAVSVSVASRIERDPTADIHERAAASVASLLSRWHFRPQEMTASLSSELFAAGALKMTGGTARTLDRENGVRRETISFTVMGSENFTQQEQTTNEGR